MKQTPDTSPEQKPELRSLATKVDEDTFSTAETISSETGLKMAELLRIGLRRLIADYRANGKIELGKEAA